MRAQAADMLIMAPSYRNTSGEFHKLPALKERKWNRDTGDKGDKGDGENKQFFCFPFFLFFLSLSSASSSSL
jgi:hypothetical protein